MCISVVIVNNGALKCVCCAVKWWSFSVSLSVLFTNTKKELFVKAYYVKIIYRMILKLCVWAFVRPRSLFLKALINTKFINKKISSIFKVFLLTVFLWWYFWKELQRKNRDFKDIDDDKAINHRDTVLFVACFTKKETKRDKNLYF